MNDIKNTIITLQGIEKKEASNWNVYLLVKDTEDNLYSLWTTKSDGTESKAYTYLKAIASNYQGRSVRIGYKEDVKEDKTYRTIIGMEQAPENQLETRLRQAEDDIDTLKAQVAVLMSFQNSPQAAKTASERAELTQAESSIVQQAPNPSVVSQNMKVEGDAGYVDVNSIPF